MTDDKQDALREACFGSEQHEKICDSMVVELTNMLNELSLSSAVILLAEAAKAKHQQQPYFNWDKDARLMEFLASYIEN